MKDAPKGCEVSLSGYFEPKGDDMDDDMFGYGQEGEEEDGDDVDDSDSEDENNPEATAESFLNGWFKTGVLSTTPTRASDHTLALG